MRLFSLLLLVTWMCVLAMAGDALPLQPGPKGGWQTVGLPYVARISATGCLESLKVNGFEFLAATRAPARGIYLVNGKQAIPITSAHPEGEALVLDAAEARVVLRFLPTALEVTVRNLQLADPNCLRLELSEEIRRMKNPDTSAEYDLPMKTITGRLRCIAPGGATLTVPGGTLTLGRNGGYSLLFPPVARQGLATTYTLDLTTTLPLEDNVKVIVKPAAGDFIYWSGYAQPFVTDVINLRDDEQYRGTLQVVLRDYVTRAVVQELRQTLSLGHGAAKSLTWTFDKLAPGMYLAEIYLGRGEGRGLCCSPRLLFNAAALLPPAPPADFDAFWQQTLTEQEQIPLDLQMTKVAERGKSDIYKFSFAGLLGYRCYGFLTMPRDATKKYPAVLLLPAAGLHPLTPPAFSKDDRVGMAISISNTEVDLPADQYDTSTWPSPYLVTGLLDRQRYTLRFAYAAVARALEVLAARPEVQSDKILVIGSGQGGGLALIAAGLSPKVKAAVAMTPGLCRLDWNLDYLAPGFFPIAASAETRPLIRQTLPYFDAAHFARRITCPVWLTANLYDESYPAVSIFTAYNALPSKDKHLQLTSASDKWPYESAIKKVWP